MDMPRLSAPTWRRPSAIAGTAPAAPVADRLAALVGLLALATSALPHLIDTGELYLDAPGESVHAVTALPWMPTYAMADGREVVLGAYGGTSYTHPSAVRIVKPGAIDLTVKDFGWIGMPFKSPIYYGLRAQHWSSPGAAVGTMLDFTHAKAIARADDRATFSGTRAGKTVAPQARIGEVFKHLEFSHGHNMVTLNALYRMPAFWTRIRPYVGGGAGVAVPHTEIGFRDDEARTYEYQYAGLVGQVLAGIEISLGRSSVFVEYKFSLSPYEVPLSQEPKGWLLIADLWRQLRAWSRGELPPGGRLSTTLATNHAIAGVLVRAGRPATSTR